MQNSINIKTKNINGEVIHTVNARDLYTFLESKQQFANWVKYRIQQHGFIENQDFILILGKTSNRGRPMKEYILSLEMAKKIAATVRHPKGKQARLYFSRILTDSSHLITRRNLYEPA